MVADTTINTGNQPQFRAGRDLKDYQFTSESVSEGHPDKICDQISDAILDLYLSENPHTRVGCETLVTKNTVIVAGETSDVPSITPDHIEKTIRETIKNIGYEQDGFHWENVEIQNKLHTQSADIALGVDEGTGKYKEEGAGDQGIMFGYATNETDGYMPATLHYSHHVLRALADARRSGEIEGIQPDSKSQITLEYKQNKPAKIKSIVLSTQHDENISQADLNAMVKPIIQRTVPDEWMDDNTEFFINPTGRFVIGGPVGDAGLTGRKIIVDTYGGAAPHGGGAFSGKDPTKVDRSAAYIARYIAKNIVAAGYAEGCTIQLSYAIGVSRPLSFYLNTHGTSDVPEEKLRATILKNIDLSPKGIREHLQLNKPIYTPSATYGHFGRRPRECGAFSWEKLDFVKTLQKEIG